MQDKMDIWSESLIYIENNQKAVFTYGGLY